MNEYPRFNIVGEEWSLNPLVVAYWQRGARNRDGYSGCLPTVMDFPLQNALVNALKEEDDKYSTKGLVKLYEALANDFGYADPLHLMVFADNHDMDRIYTQLGEDAALTKMAIGYLLTVRGIPQMYYGTEIFMQNTGFPKNDGLIRSDLPGGWKGDAVNVFTGEGLTGPQKDMQQYVRQLLNWRKGNQVIAAGKTLHFAPFDGLYVYFRQHQSGTVMVVMNKGNQAKALDLDRLAEGLGRRTMARNVVTGAQTSLKQLQVPARTTGIYELK